jgi:hypothetical protein
MPERCRSKHRFPRRQAAVAAGDFALTRSGLQTPVHGASSCGAVSNANRCITTAADCLRDSIDCRGRLLRSYGLLWGGGLRSHGLSWGQQGHT